MTQPLNPLLPTLGLKLNQFETKERLKELMLVPTLSNQLFIYICAFISCWLTYFSWHAKAAQSRDSSFLFFRFLFLDVFSPLSPAPLPPTPPLPRCLFLLIFLFNLLLHQALALDPCFFYFVFGLMKVLCAACNHRVQRFARRIFWASSEHICIFMYRFMSLLLRSSSLSSTRMPVG